MDNSEEIIKLKTDTRVLQNKLDNETLSPSDIQRYLDMIRDNNRRIEMLSREESVFVPVTNAPKVANHVAMRKSPGSFGYI